MADGEPTDRKAFPLRLDRATFDAIQRWADDELRSVNAQIAFVLREALTRRGRLPRPVRNDGEPAKQQAEDAKEESYQSPGAKR